MIKIELNTIEEATKHWVRGFNAISQSLIERAFGGENIDNLHELTVPSEGDNVYSFELDGQYEIIEKNGEKIILDNYGEKFETSIDEIELERDGYLPMWGTMWTFEERIDSEWVLENLEIVSKCGFRIYVDDDGDVYIGIDGAGYDFYEAHWIPLYKARGLRWHNTSNE